MVKILRRWKLSEDINKLRGSSIGTKIKYLWRKGWTEIPVIMATSILPIIGLTLISYTYWYHETHDMTPKYYRSHRIYRPEDPRVQRIRHTSIFDQ